MWVKVPSDMYAQWKLTLACSPVQSDQSFHCLHEKTASLAIQNAPSKDSDQNTQADLILHQASDLIIPGLVTNETAKICCRALILALFYSTMVIKNYSG